jgi:hypothetical protein
MNDTDLKNTGPIGAGHIGSQIARLAVANDYNVNQTLAVRDAGLNSCGVTDGASKRGRILISLLRIPTGNRKWSE